MNWCVNTIWQIIDGHDLSGILELYQEKNNIHSRDCYAIGMLSFSTDLGAWTYLILAQNSN